MVLIFACGNGDKNPPLAVFSGGQVFQDEYIDHYLLSTKYKPDAMPDEKKLRDIVTQKAVEKMAVLEALSRNVHLDTVYQEMLARNRDRILFYKYMRRGIIDSVVTDSLVEKFYHDFSPQYRMSYIVRPVRRSAAPEFDRVQRDSIEFIHKRLESGEPFDQLAKKYSQDLVTRDKGGDLGFLITENMGDRVLRTVMDTLQQFSFSEPVRGYEAYYILYKGERRDVEVPPFDTVREKIWMSLYRSRRHVIQEKVDERFAALAPKYHYQVDESALEMIIDKAGGRENSSPYTYLDFDSLGEGEMSANIATYDSGAIRLYELFAQRSKAPANRYELRERLSVIAQQHLLAQHAKELGYGDDPEVKQDIDKVRDSLLGTYLLEYYVDERAEALGDSLGPGSIPDRKTASPQYKQRLKREMEENLKLKYNLQFVTENFAKAMESAAEKKRQITAQKEREPADAELSGD